MSFAAKPEHIVDVAVPVPLRRSFDYQSEVAVKPGSRVLIPFRSRQLVGVVLPTSPDKSIRKLKNIISVLDEEPSIPSTMLEFYIWSADYYHYPLGEMIQAALPPNLRKAIKQYDPDTPQYYMQNPDIPEVEALSQLSRAPKQKQLYLSLTGGQCLRLDEIAKLPQLVNVDNLTGSMNILKKKELIIATNQAPEISKEFAGTLNPEQSETLSRIEQSKFGFNTHLIHGITGSGKTEIYLHAIKTCLDAGQQALVIVPEISLTKQLVERFASRFGHRVHCYHSGINPSQRYRTWWKARNGSAGVVLGTRSAVFMPILNLARIVVDEEHDLSLKQMDGFRYHARDLAIKRASLEDIPIILGSATPSMESMQNARSGKYQISKLRQRTGDAILPKIEFIDLRKQSAKRGLSSKLIGAVNEQLNRGQQSILYINRRGYAPIAECPHCQWRACCDRCDAYMTYHKISDQLCCHYCGKTAVSPELCPQCRSPLFFRGTGTQRIEESLQELFPNASILRFDRDQVRSFRQLQETLDRINNGQADIIVGTRMISKGHDFKGVTLVGIINPDYGLYSIDFRAPEQLFQDLMQVAGRSGRGEDPGRVLIQTHHPHNPYMQMVRDQDYDAFFDSCQKERAIGKVPPFSCMALWRAESRQPKIGFRLLHQIKQQGELLLASEDRECIEIMDPVNSPMGRLDGWHRVQLLVKSNNRNRLHQVLRPWVFWAEKIGYTQKLRWSLDIDPMEIL